VICHLSFRPTGNAKVYVVTALGKFAVVIVVSLDFYAVLPGSQRFVYNKLRVGDSFADVGRRSAYVCTVQVDFVISCVRIWLPFQLQALGINFTSGFRTREVQIMFE
jgi:hypothetical protein